MQGLALLVLPCLAEAAIVVVGIGNVDREGVLETAQTLESTSYQALIMVHMHADP